VAEKKEKSDKDFLPVWSVPFQRQGPSSTKVLAPRFSKNGRFPEEHRSSGLVKNKTGAFIVVMKAPIFVSVRSESEGGAGGPAPPSAIRRQLPLAAGRHC
jgi:hypothetical protein